MAQADPFENATKQVNDACDVLGIDDEGIRNYLIMPNRFLRVKVPVKMDDGKIRVFTGFRCQHNNDRGPYKGGIRYFDPEGGVEYMEREVMALSSWIPQKDIPAPDVYTTGKEMTQIMDTFTKMSGNNYSPGTITGKPIPVGGSLARNVATGLGNAYCIREAAKILNIELKGAKVVLQGFGNASTFSGEYLEKMGATCIATSDSKGSILVPDGFKVQELINWKQKEGSVIGYPGSKEISTEELLTTECEVLVPGALENQITAEIAEKLQCKIIGEAANGPTLPEADPILHKKGVFVIPDILANSGGVCISYLEWVQNNMGYYWSFDEVASKMETNIVKGLKDMHDLSKKHNIDNRRAAMVLAVSRVLEAFNHKGIWP